MTICASIFWLMAIMEKLISNWWHISDINATSRRMDIFPNFEYKNDLRCVEFGYFQSFRTDWLLANGEFCFCIEVQPFIWIFQLDSIIYLSFRRILFFLQSQRTFQNDSFPIISSFSVDNNFKINKKHSSKHPPFVNQMKFRRSFKLKNIIIIKGHKMSMSFDCSSAFN